MHGLILGIAMAIIVTGCSLTTFGQDLAIRNVTLISPELIEPKANVTVLVEDGKIVGIQDNSRRVNAKIVIDGSDQFLIPGLIDSHIHLFHATGLKQRYTDDYEMLYTRFLEQQPRSYLYHGFTTLVEPSSNPRITQAFKAETLRPDLIHCGAWTILSDGYMSLEAESGISEDFPNFFIDHYAGGFIPEGASPERHTPSAVVAGVVNSGGQCVKLHYEEALWWPGGAPGFSLPSKDIVRDIIAEAHNVDIPVLLHATTPKAHEFALEVKVDILAHGLWEWPDQDFDDPEPDWYIENLASRVAKSDISLQPTIQTIRNTASLFREDLLEDPAWLNVVSQAYVDYLRTDAQVQRGIFLEMFAELLPEGRTSEDMPDMQSVFSARYQKLIGTMASEGATLLFATDTAVGGFGWGSPPGLAGYWEMQAMVDGGVSLKALFASLTINNARAFHLDNEVGTIEVGKTANMLLLRQNPLTDVSAYNTIDTVILHGAVHDREALSARITELKGDAKVKAP